MSDAIRDGTRPKRYRKELFDALWKICETQKRPPLSQSSFTIVYGSAGPRTFCLRYIKATEEWGKLQNYILIREDDRRALELAVRRHTAARLRDMINFCVHHYDLSISLQTAVECDEEYKKAWRKYAATHGVAAGTQPEEIRGWWLKL